MVCPWVYMNFFIIHSFVCNKGDTYYSITAGSRQGIRAPLKFKVNCIMMSKKIIVKSSPLCNQNMDVQLVNEELLIIDKVGLLRNVGGLLGHFVGFPLFGYASLLFDAKLLIKCVQKPDKCSINKTIVCWFFTFWLCLSFVLYYC